MDQLENYRKQLDATACIDDETRPCPKTVVLLPLRYAVVGVDYLPNRALPDLPPQLAAGFPRLLTSKYAVRLLREGYLYIFSKQSGKWSSVVLRFDHSGRAVRHDPEQENPSTLSEWMERNQRAPSGSLIEFPNPDRYEEVRLLFTPDAMTQSFEALYRDNEEFRNKLQRFNVRQLAYQYEPLEDTIAPEQLGELVLDYRMREGMERPPLKQTGAPAPHAAEIRAAMQEQLFPLDERPLPPREVVKAGLVLRDPIGITQELAAWRNAGQESLKAWLDAPSRTGVSNERLVLVAKQFREVRRLFQTRRAAVASQHEIDIERARVMDSGIAAGRNAVLDAGQRAVWNYEAEQYLDARAQQITARYEARIEQGVYAREFDERYTRRVDIQLMSEIDGARVTEEDKAYDLALLRAPDHLAWLTSPQMIEALASYDSNNAATGWAFAHQTGVMVMGMEGTPEGARVLQDWWMASRIEPGNIALRAITFNQAQVQQALLKAFDRLPPPQRNDTTFDGVQTALRQSTDLLEAYGALDDYLENVAAFGVARPAGALTWVSSLGREVLRSGKPKFEIPMHHPRMNLLLASFLGMSDETIQRMLELDARDQAARAAAARAEVHMLNQQAVDKLLAPYRSEFRKIRITGGLLVLQSSVLMMQARQQDEKPGARLVAEFTSAALVTAAAAHEFLAAGTERVIATNAADSPTHRAALIKLGRHRLWGAGLSGVAGLISIRLDLGDLIDASRNADDSASSVETNTLMSAYMLRIGGTFALIGGQGGTAFAVAAPLFRSIAAKGGRGWIVQGAKILAPIAEDLAANRAAMLLLARFTFWGFVVITFATILIALFDDDALEEWCDRSCYRLGSDESPYPTTGEELHELSAALVEVT